MKPITKIITGFATFICLIIIILFSVIAFESRTYLTDYFNVQKKKLNLRKEESVDSLQNVINLKSKTIDSLLLINKEFEKQIINEKKLNKSLTKIMLKEK